MRHQIVLFTKPAAPGLVKTRLQVADGSGCPQLMPEQAAALHRAFLEDTSSTLLRAASALPSTRLSIAWALDGGLEPEPGFDLFDHFAQVGDSLGDRLFHGLSHGDVNASRVAAAGAGMDSSGVVVAVGSDHPELTAQQVIEALQSVASQAADLAIGPADDGGYYLLAVRRDRLSTELFDGIEWSTDSVLEQTLARCQSAGLRVHRLPVGFDCDTPLDLHRLCQRMVHGSEGHSARGSATRRWLRHAGLLADRAPIRSLV